MSGFALHLVEGLARPQADVGAETELVAASPDFAAAWAAVQAVHPAATLRLLFGGDDGLSRDVLVDLADVARMSGVEPPDLLRWFELECPDDLADELLAPLQALPLFDWLGERPTPQPAQARDGVVSWGCNPGAADDPALRAAPRGVDAIYGWRVSGGTGLGASVADVESGWWLDHDDLLTARIVKHSLFGAPTADDIDHGTACAGIIVGADNGAGMVGLAPDAQLLLVSDLREDGRSKADKAIAVAAAGLGPGGVLLVELAWPYNLGRADLLVETFSPVHEAIRHATALGVTVIEPSGNGAIDLANPPKPKNPTRAGLDLQLPMRVDSGAVVVGAGGFRTSSGQWERAAFSTYGDRVDCFGDGGGVTAPATGSHSDLQSFRGTSGASAIIAGLVANIQGMALAAGRGPLSPQDIRNLLRNPKLGTPLGPGQTGVGNLPDLRKIARAQVWAQVVPVAAAPVTDNAALLAYLDDDDRLIRRHFSVFSGWGRPLPVIDKGDLWPAQPCAISWREPDRLIYQVLASGPGGVQRAWWDSNLTQEPFTLLATSSGNTIAPGSAFSAVRAAEDDLVLVGVDGHAQLIALPANMFYPGVPDPIRIGGAARFHATTGPAAVSVAQGWVEVVAIADNGGLVWCHGDKPFDTGWQPPVSEPSFTRFIPGARPAALALDGRVLVAAVGEQGWLHAIEINPSEGAGPSAFQAPVVVDTGATYATEGPLALARLVSPPFDMVLLFGVDTEGLIRVSSRPAAGGDWTPVLGIPADVAMSPLGGVTAISAPDLGVMVFAVGTDGRVRTAHARSLFDWSEFAPLPEGTPLPPDPPPPSPAPGSQLISNAFRNAPVLEAVAADKDRISRTRNAGGEWVRKIQHALLLWDAACLPTYGEDAQYGDETAQAVRAFKAQVLRVPPGQIIDDVGPATVLRLDRIQAESEGLLGAKTTLRFVNEYGDPLAGLQFSITTPATLDMLTTDASGEATTYLIGPAQVALDPGSALSVLGDLLNREWPPAGGFPKGVLLTPAAATTATAAPGDVLQIVVASRVELSAALAAPLAGAVRVDGPGVALDTSAETVRLSLQATGERAATIFVDPLAPVGAPPELPPLAGWSPPGVYAVRPGDTAESLAEAFVNDPNNYAALSDHPPVVGEQLTLPEAPGWLEMALAPVTAPSPVEWFTVSADQIVAAILAGGETAPLQDLLAVLDRPPAPGADVVTDLASRAEALTALLSGPPVGPAREVEDEV